jgi:hypothetical protein
MNFVGYAWESGQNITSQQEDFTNAIFLKRIKIKKISKINKKSKMMQNKNYRSIYFIMKDSTTIKKQNYSQGNLGLLFSTKQNYSI